MTFFKKVFAIFKKKWFWWLFGLISVCLLVWFLLPLITFGGQTPFSSSIRLFIILVLVIIWSIINIQIIRHEKEKTRALEYVPQDPKIIDDALILLQTHFDKVLQIVSQGRWFEKYFKRNAFNTPWYLLIGAPQSGRSSLLRHSGLPYPVANESYQPFEQKENELCQWWFSKEAIFIDTHADLCTDLDEESVPAKIFDELLTLLKRYRRAKPLNGIVFTIDLHDFLQKDTKERANAAHIFRMQLQKINNQLGIQCPVYVVLTKMDLISGFTDFFNHLNEEQRKDVMGFTLKYNPITDSVRDVLATFNELVHRLNQQLITHLHNEKEPKKAALVHDFSLQLNAIKESLDKYLHDIFESNHFHQKLALRGVFFTSSLQKNISFDYLAIMTRQVYGIDVVNEQPQMGHKSFFNYGFFMKALLPERNVLLFNTRQALRNKRHHYAAYAAAGLVGLLFVVIWANSYMKNSDNLDAMKIDIDNFRRIPGNLQNQNNSLLYVLPMLNKLEDMSETYEPETDPLSLHWGLYQGDKVNDVADQIYRQNLLIYLMPYVIYVVTTELHNPDAKANQLYNALRVYLMLANPSKLNKEFTQSWLSNYWGRQYQNQADMLQSLNQHLSALLDLGIKPIKIDPELVQQAREKLRFTTQAERNYFELQELADTNDLDQLHISSGVNVDFNQVFGSDASRLSVPVLYTFNGYSDLFKAHLTEITSGQNYSSWVLGESAEKSIDLSASKSDVTSQVRDLYMSDYISYWNKVIAGLNVQPFFSLKQASTILNIVSGANSPIYGVLQTISDNTTLNPIVAGAASSGANFQKQLQANKALVSALQPKAFSSVSSKANRFKPKNTNKKGSGKTASGDVTPVDQTFASLNQLFVSGDGKDASTTIDKVMDGLSKLNDYVMDINTSPDPSEKAYQLVIANLAAGGTAGGAAGGTAGGTAGGKGDDPLSQLTSQAAALPQPIKGWILAIVNNTWGAMLNGAADYVNTQYHDQLWPDYKASITGRYPFTKSASDRVSMADFADFFQPGGKIETFFNKYLKQFADVTKPHWTWLVINGKSMGISTSILAQFQRADQIKTAFFDQAGAPPKLSFSISATSMSANLKGAILNLNGQILDYRHGPRRSTPFTWQAGVNPMTYSLSLQDISDSVKHLQGQGDWGLFALIDQGQISSSAGSTDIILNFGPVSYVVTANGTINPFNRKLIGQLRLPENLEASE